MTHSEFYETLAAKTGDELDTIERLGFELHVPTFEPDRKEAKRQRRLRLWRQQRRERSLAELAHKVVQS